MDGDIIKGLIAKNLPKIRKSLHLTQKEAAAKAGINMNYYAKVERGSSMPSLKTLKKICKAFGVTSTDITGF